MSQHSLHRYMFEGRHQVNSQMLLLQLKCCGTDGPKDWDEVEHGDDALKSCGSNTDVSP